MAYYTLREFGRIYEIGSGTAESKESLDCCFVETKVYKALLEFTLERQAGSDQDFLRQKSYGGNMCLQVKNYVGVFEYAGVQFEVLPKTTSDEQDLTSTRQILWRILQVVYGVKPEQLDIASLASLRHRWLDALIHMVLMQISKLVRRGLRSEYLRVDNEASFLRGQLNVAKQIRQNAGRQHHFQIRYDKFNQNRSENRLLKSCLQRLDLWSKTLENKRLCRELIFAFTDIPASSNTQADLAAWRTDRSMTTYQELLPWVKLILSNQAPVFSQGADRGISLLFPMEKLFEGYVGKLLTRQLDPAYRLKTQAASKYLVREHNGRPMFQLKPDFLIHSNHKNTAVLDAKWKLIDASKQSTSEKYDLKQSDFYQMFAYAEKYLEGSGDLFLIYPKHANFHTPLSVFTLTESTRLWVVPFDLQNGECLIEQTGSKVEWYRALS